MRRRVLARLLCLVSSENDNDLRWRLLQSSHSCWPGCVLASHVLVRLRLTEGVGCDLTLSCASGTIKDGKTKMLSRPGRFACTFCFNLNIKALRSAVFSALRRLGLAVRQRHGPPPPQRRVRLRKPHAIIQIIESGLHASKSDGDVVVARWQITRPTRGARSARRRTRRWRWCGGSASGRRRARSRTPTRSPSAIRACRLATVLLGPVS